MGKIKNFCGKWFGAEFGKFIFFLLGVNVISISVQRLLIWAGWLHCGMMLDTILGMLLIMPALIAFALTKHKGTGNIIVGLLAIMGIYISVVWYFHAGILVGCLVLLYSALWRLYKLGYNLMLILGGACVYLLYCIGAYFAMTANSLEPAINLYGIITLVVATLCVWFIPATK